jgi:hypothetical protein
MAIFGIGAGKILAGLGAAALLKKGAKSKDPFTRGIVKGVTGTATQLAKDDMQRTQERIDRIAEYKIRSQEREEERYNTDLRDATEKIREIAGRVGGINGAEYLVRNYGLVGGLERAKQIQTLSEKLNRPLSEAFITKDENQTSISDLAKYIATPPKSTSVSKIKDDSLFASIGLGRDIGAEAQRQIDMAAEGILSSNDYTVDLGEMPNFKEKFDFGMAGDISSEYNRQVLIALNEKSRGNNNGYKEHMVKAQELKTIANAMDSESLSPGSVNSLANTFQKRILRAGNVNGKNTYNQTLDKYVWVMDDEKAVDLAAVDSASSILADVVNQAVKNGMDYSKAVTDVTNLALNNQTPEFAMVGGLPTIRGLQNEDKTISKLIPGGFKGAGPNNPFSQSKINGNNNDTQMSESEIKEILGIPQDKPLPENYEDLLGLGPKDTNELISKFNLATDLKQKENILIDILNNNPMLYNQIKKKYPDISKGIYPNNISLP